FHPPKLTFPHERYHQYNAPPQKTPPQFSQQFPLLNQLLKPLPIPHFHLPRFQPHHIIATLTKPPHEAPTQLLVVSPHKHMLHLPS
ncbi:hypothetical protein, partial [Paenibacillus xylanexedens]|uniref:hypothetical protein n=1 Tax=Paenibacillus xylanexedens TaxID=528191 RepID=UPI0011A72C68